MTEPGCDVFKGLCGAYIEGNCELYSDGLSHNWIEPDLDKRIKQCEHRQRVNFLFNKMERLKKYVKE